MVLVSLIMIRRKNALFAHFYGKLAKLKIFQAKYRLFHLILILLNNKKIYQKNKKYIYIFNKIYKKKVVRQNKLIFARVGSSVNISYWAAVSISVIIFTGVNGFVIVLKKYEGMQMSLSNFAHTYILALWSNSKFATRNMLYLPS